MNSKHFEVLTQVVRHPRHGATDAGQLRAEVQRDETFEILAGPVTIVDFSRGGCRLRTADSLLSGESVVVRLHDDASGRVLEAAGRVRWSNASEGEYESGCEFDKPIDYEQLGELFLAGFLSTEEVAT